MVSLKPPAAGRQKIERRAVREPPFYIRGNEKVEAQPRPGLFTKPSDFKLRLFPRDGFENQDMKPFLAITMGDPLGIGPEVVVKALRQEAFHRLCHPLVIGDPGVLRQTVAALGVALRVVEVEGVGFEAEPGKIFLLPGSSLPLGRDLRELPRDASARAAFAYLETAGRLALTGKVHGIVTGPVNKEAIHRAGIPFRGHTEYLAEISQTRKFAMMLAGERLRVALVTTHIAHEAVAKSLTGEAISNVIEVTHQGLREFFRIPAPRLGVAALNPHAGEGGLFGTEEKMISGAVKEAAGKGLNVSGPWPADTLFYRAVRGEFDAVVCMYHDQALIPLKLLQFDSAVNSTLGLPFIRTSVDHGVAYDLAGRGSAHSRSLEEAIRLAAQMALYRQGAGSRE
jgi:4-hydroxythreonine-4-phosphate dehydrogenase